MRPGRVPSPAFALDERARSRRRARSRSPGCRACRPRASPSRRAWSRTSALVSGPTGNDGLRQLLLRQREEEVGLVLVRVGAAPQQPPSVGGRVHARVVAGRDLRGAQARGALEQRRELEVAVAVGAGQRRAARRVLLHEVRRPPPARTAARSSGCSAGRRSPRPPAGRRAGRRWCSRCRSSRRCAGRRAASTRPPRRGPPRPAAPRPPTSPRRPTSRPRRAWS